MTRSALGDYGDLGPNCLAEDVHSRSHRREQFGQCLRTGESTDWANADQLLSDPASNGLTNNWSASGLQADYSNEYSVRIDHNFSDKTRLYGRFLEKA